MVRPIVTLTTDFGLGSPYVAEMKGVLLGLLPDVQLVDITHAISPQDIEQAAWELAQVVPAFPPQTVHIAVVDPGVGTARTLLAGEIGTQRFVGPDNGIFSVCVGQAQRAAQTARWVALNQRQYWRDEVSPTFHGRDIMAAVAAHWCRGVTWEQFGSRVEELQQLPQLWPEQGPVSDAGMVWLGRIARVDHFGNLLTNLHVDAVPGWDLARVGPQAGTQSGAQAGTQIRAEVELWTGERLPLRYTYGEVASGAPAALVSSSGYVELAVRDGSGLHHWGNGAPGACGGLRGAQVRLLISPND